MKNDEAAGALIGLTLLFLLCGIMFVVVGFGIDRITLAASSSVLGDAAAQLRFDVLNIQLLIFRLEPFIVLLGGGINYWINRNRQMSGEVDVGSTLIAGAEMILVTLVLVVLNMFGGGALDTVTKTVDAWNFVPIADHYTLIQYLPNAFYGIVMLLTVAVVAAFVISMFKVVDYSNTYSV